MRQWHVYFLDVVLPSSSLFVLREVLDVLLEVLFVLREVLFVLLEVPDVLLEVLFDET